MTAVFDTMLSVSVNSLWVIGAVLLVRALLTKRAKSMRMLLWALVALRLAIPFTLESNFSLIPEETVIELSADEEVPVEQSEKPDALKDSQTVTDVPVNIGNTVTVNKPVMDEPVMDEPIPDNSGAVQAPVINDVPFEEPSVSQREPVAAEKPADDAEPVKQSLTYKEISIIIWLVGIALIACYHIGAHIALGLRLRDAYRAKDNIWRSDRIPGAFSYGVIKPKIYIPSFINGKEEEYIIAHERAHISHGDHIYKLLAVVLLCVYWYNPLVWLSYYLFCRDMEYACDERVIRGLDDKGVKEYLKTLVKHSAGKRGLTGPLLAFNSKPVKRRIENMLNYKKPALWISAMCVVLAGIIVICFMTVPAASEASSNDDNAFAADTTEEQTETEELAEPTEEPTEAPTEEPIEASTEESTEAPTEEPTEAPTEEPTEAPTEEPTEAPTEAPTEEPTEASTEEPTEAPTEAPTEEPTEAPTEAPTEEPTEFPTEAPSEKPTEEPYEEPTEEPSDPEPPELKPTPLVVFPKIKETPGIEEKLLKLNDDKFITYVDGYDSIKRQLFTLDGVEYGRVISSSDSAEDAVRVCKRHFNSDRLYPMSANTVVECRVIYESDILYGIYVKWQHMSNGEYSSYYYEENVISFKKSVADVTVYDIDTGDEDSFAVSNSQEDVIKHIALYLFSYENKIVKLGGHDIFGYETSSDDKKYVITVYSYGICYGDWNVPDQYDLIKQTVVIDKATGNVTFGEPVVLRTAWILRNIYPF